MFGGEKCCAAVRVFFGGMKGKDGAGPGIILAGWKWECIAFPLNRHAGRGWGKGSTLKPMLSHSRHSINFSPHFRKLSKDHV